MGEHLQKAILPKHYENYVFDLYGTLVCLPPSDCNDYPSEWP